MKTSSHSIAAENTAQWHVRTTDEEFTQSQMPNKSKKKYSAIVKLNKNGN